MEKVALAAEAFPHISLQKGFVLETCSSAFLNAISHVVKER